MELMRDVENFSFLAVTQRTAHDIIHTLYIHIYILFLVFLHKKQQQQQYMLLSA